MKISALLLVLFMITHCTDITTVYICDSKSGRKYHLKANCRGLSTCSHTIRKLTLDEAKKRRKTICAWEK